MYVEKEKNVNKIRGEYAIFTTKCFIILPPCKISNVFLSLRLDKKQVDELRLKIEQKNKFENKTETSR